MTEGLTSLIDLVYRCANRVLRDELGRMFVSFFIGLGVAGVTLLVSKILSRKRAYHHGYNKGYEDAREDFASSHRVEEL